MENKLENIDTDGLKILEVRGGGGGSLVKASSKFLGTGFSVL
jgi:hypothetical protein